MQAIILAGGKGSRLRPFTITLPKPLVPVDDMPILEIVLRQLKNANFHKITIAVGHLAELIMAFFRNGEKFGLKIDYSIEDKILGTAGPLSLIENLQDNFLVMNGDILTTLDYGKFFAQHIEHGNDLTIATYKKEVKIDLGVLEIEDGMFKDYIEKPTYYFNVSMGIYAFNKNIVGLIPQNEYMDLPDLVLKAKQAGKKIECYSGDYYWLDIGRVNDYEEAIKIFKEKRREFLRE